MSTSPSPFQNKSPLLAVNWLRVVLDEGHVIRNPNAQMSKAVLALKAQRRWILSGLLIFMHVLRFNNPQFYTPSHLSVGVSKLHGRLDNLAASRQAPRSRTA